MTMRPASPPPSTSTCCTAPTASWAPTSTLRSFAHRATYDVRNGRIDMHLVSRTEQSVRVLGRRFHFAVGERIHTEHSHKYDIEGFQALASVPAGGPKRVDRRGAPVQRPRAFGGLNRRHLPQPGELRYKLAMTWHKGGPGARRGYHHGNLREALITAALDLISKKGPAGFTFADAARAAGVSPAAPYRHFRDRDALMADVARRGFEAFTEALSRAWDSGKPTPRAAFERVGRAYLAFAAKEPALFSAMFELGVPIGDYPEVREAGDRAFERAARRVRGGGGDAAERKAAAVADDGAAHLVAEPRHRVAVRPRRRGAPADPDDAGGSARGRRAHLPRRPRRPTG